MTTRTRIHDALMTVNPTQDDARHIRAWAAGRTLTAHPTTLAELHAAAVQHGPMIARTTLAVILDAPVRPDDTVPEGLVLVVGREG